MKATSAISFVAGVVFAIGLVVAGINQPAKVLNFVDVLGDWDPSLGVVMLAAVAVIHPFHRWTQRRAGAPAIRIKRGPIDWKLLIGAVVFGVGWGLGGLCPGPSVVSIVSGAPAALVLFGAMLVGMAPFSGPP